ncbi:uncharacterized protein BXZ73DRAFT_105591 [Epithele typhae]|uniref:uncharacterized protein n=1 Tax=Epithele typhae TaxID=378194 RepID=UPI002007B932|nr:uncharacterized protein BXZ73DRAFT_105591 [Epithele typhae]KAH9917113.1 hypothetical protein BXZ73DRAFT_105591 [Epithele typhae]
MPSYLRNLFGGSSSKSSRSNSTPAPIYIPTSGPSSPAPPQMQRTHSHQASAPSPLRYTTADDTRTRYGYGRAPASHHGHGSSQAYVESRPRRASFKTPDTPRSALYTPSVGYTTPGSSRTNSASSLYPAGSLPRTPSSEHGHGYSSRPPLSHSNHTWHPSGTVGSSSSYGSRGRARTSSQSSLMQQTRSTTLHMHPLLAHTKLHRAPILYDVSFTPGARTVLDHATRSAIPSHTLQQPATDPPLPAGARLVLHSHKFPWAVIVTSAASRNHSHSPEPRSRSRPRFTIGHPRDASRDREGAANSISNLDVLCAVHATLLEPVTPEEWEALGAGSKAQQKVTAAYQRRCTRQGGGWANGVLRIDWLGEKTSLIGVEVDKAAGHGGAGKLVFGRP